MVNRGYAVEYPWSALSPLYSGGIAESAYQDSAGFTLQRQPDGRSAGPNLGLRSYEI
jgi:hypothetical protein